jgi:phosphatidylglycerophosphatase A
MKKNPPLADISRGLDHLAVCLASVFYLSYLPAGFVHFFQMKFRGETLTDLKFTGAGLVGSIAGVITYLLLPYTAANSIFVVLSGLAFSTVVAHRAEKALGSHDDSRIVIDEWVGSWLACLGLDQVFGVWIVVAFLLFRAFDVFKGPWGHWLQRLPGGWGVVMDDVAAGLIANGLVRLLHHTL